MPFKMARRNVRSMTPELRSGSRRIAVATVAVMILATARMKAEAPSAAAIKGFNSYVQQVETRIDGQHRSAEHYLVPASSADLRQGELVIEQLTAENGQALPGALLHDWRGTAFVPGATGSDFERMMRNFGAYPQNFRPQLLRAKVLSQQGDRYRVMLRVRQKHILTVVMDATYDVTFGNLDSRHGYSVSRSTKVNEIASPDTANERVLSSSEEHGFLWRINTYWSYVEGSGGLYIQIESVTLTRSIPTGLGWLIGPFIESIPRESLEFTLGATREALRMH